MAVVDRQGHAALAANYLNAHGFPVYGAINAPITTRPKERSKGFSACTNTPTPLLSR